MATAPARVLVVDDSPTIRRVVSQVLRQAGYDVATAENGETGLAEARAMSPDLILLDFMMPGMNGYQFVKELDVEDAGRAPVVLMCTRTDQVPEGALKGMGVVDNITKPFSPDAILAVVSYCLDKHGVAKRQETTRVTLLAQKNAVSHEEARPPKSADDFSDANDKTLPGVVPPSSDDAPVVSTDDDRARAAQALQDLARVLADALFARGVSDADALATSICADVRAGLPSATLSEIVKRPQPSLSGDLAAVPLPEVLQLLKFQGQTGVLEVALEGPTPEAPPARFDVAVKSGSVIAVRARDVRADLLLGHYFIGSGLLSRAQLDAVLAKPSDTPIGQRLVEAGLITTEQLRRCVGAQAQDLMVELLRARRGYFGLRRGEDLLPSTHISPGFSVDMLLFEGLRRIDEWGVIEQQVPSFDARFVLHSDDIHDLSPGEIEVLSIFKEGTSLSVRDVLRVSSLRAFDACKLLYRLAMLRRLRRVDDGAPVDLVTDDGAAPQLSGGRSGDA
jgi:CheY-like chemotaxis protein